MIDYIGHQFGNYQLLRLLGRGSFAQVYLAEHRYLEVPAAIKVLHVRMESAAHEMFRREAYTIAHLQHPHIVRILDFGIQDATPFLVMEYCPNGTLRSMHPKGTCLPPELIVRYVKQIAAALDYAHQQQVIHRDIKPENLLLNAQGKVVLSDFGLAIVQQTLDSLPTLQPAGTPPYMAPEQILRKPCAASDQYAVGVLVYEWITGKLPFRGSLFEVWNQHLHQPPPSLREQVPWLPLAAEDAVLGAVAKNPQQRFACVQDFAGVLEDAFFTTESFPSLVIGQDVPQSQESDSVSLASMKQASLEMRQDDSIRKASPSSIARSRAERGQEPAPSSTTRSQAERGQEPAPMGTIGLTLKHHDTVAHHHFIGQINRLRLLRRVRAIWIAGVLEHSLHGASLLSWGLQEQPDAIANPWHLVLQSPLAILQHLPAGTRITQIYDTAEGELLILGAPGSGKTTLLLELARDLLDRAEQNEQYPIPVVFNLSAWAANQQCLTDWLVEELTSKYQVPRKLGKALVNAGQILPLLDGLDEVAPRERTRCIEAINTYHQEHGWQPLVVCSRSADYLAQPTRVQLGCAVMIQPLTEQQIDDYLLSGGEPLLALRIAMHQDRTLRELACTPLMLSVLTLTYQGMSVEELLEVPSLSERQRLVFEQYVERMLTRRRVDKGYTPQQIMHWLSWLAQQLAQRSLTVFHIERMQPNWLNDQQSQQHYSHASAALIFGLIGSLTLGFPGGQLLTSLFAKGSTHTPWLGLFCLLFFGLISGLCFGLLNRSLYKHEMEIRVSRSKWSWKGIWRRIMRSVLNGLLAGLLIGLPYGFSLAQPQDNVLNWMIMSGGITWLLVGLVFGLIDTLLGIQMTEIRLTGSFVWSWIRMGRSFMKFLFLGLAGSFLFGLILGLVEVLSSGRIVNVLTVLSSILGYGLQFVLFLSPFALISGLLGGLADGLSRIVLDERDLALPNQGIRHCAYHSVLIGLVSGLVGGMVVGGLTEVITGVQDPKQLWPLVLTYGLIVGSFTGVIGGLRQGGIACIQHMVLRWLLWKRGAMPWNYSRFLDYAAERILLRKVGGGYIFLHRLLLDYFASLEVGSVSNRSGESRNDAFPLHSPASLPVKPIGEVVLSDIPTVPLALTSAPIQVEGPHQLPCGHELRSHARFCSVCGAPIPLACQCFSDVISTW